MTGHRLIKNKSLCLVPVKSRNQQVLPITHPDQTSSSVALWTRSLLGKTKEKSKTDNYCLTTRIQIFNMLQ